MANQLHYGDNLDVLRTLSAESVDLVYLDPPFNSNASYNQLFKSPDGKTSAAQVEAFEDTWHWTDAAAAAYEDVRRHRTHSDAAQMIVALRAFLGENDMMAYLAMMAVRLIELHRVLKPTGSLYLHCDPTASHYLKILLDAVFGPKNFHNEIIWKRTSAHGNVSANYGDVTDTILYFSKAGKPQWNKPYAPLTADNIAKKYAYVEADGRRYTTRDLRNPGYRPNLIYDYKGYKPHPNGWSISRELMEKYDAEGRLYFPKEQDGRIRLKLYLDDSQGRAIHNLWDDIPPINSQAQERLGYPTQKPVALLERILSASSNPGDVVLDPFCGCGTTIHAAQKLGRQWIGIDITHLAIGLIEKRLRDAFPGVAFTTHGVPKDLEGARDLALRGRYHEFEKWALSLINAQPGNFGKKGADRGIDGNIWFGKTGRAIVSVKAGENVEVSMVRDLRGTIEREGADIGVFLTLATPGRPMQTEAAAAGQFTLEDCSPVPRLQIVTVEQAMALRERAVALPLRRADTFRRAAREEGGRQGAFEI